MLRRVFVHVIFHEVILLIFRLEFSGINPYISHSVSYLHMTIVCFSFKFDKEIVNV